MPASCARLAHMGSVSRNAKRPALRPGASLQSKAFCDLLRGLAVGDGDETLVGRLDEVGLDLDRLVERLGADELLERGGRLLEGLLGVIGGLDRDRLGALGDDAEALQSGVGVVLAELLDGVDLDHCYPLPAPQRRLLIAFCAVARLARAICALHNRLSREIVQCTIRDSDAAIPLTRP